MDTLSRSARLEIAVKLMDQPTREKYNRIVRYCEATGKGFYDLTKREKIFLSSQEFEQRQEEMTLADGA